MKKSILSLISLLIVFAATAQLSIGVTNSFVSSNAAFPPKQQPAAFLKNSFSGRVSYDFPLTGKNQKTETRSLKPYVKTLMPTMKEILKTTLI